MKRPLVIFGFAAVISHALMSAAAGSVIPSNWSVLEICVCIFILAPCAALAVAVLEGVFDEAPAVYSGRDRKRSRDT
jgi:hypothetical protein